jgi:hypothetical protein
MQLLSWVPANYTMAHQNVQDAAAQVEASLLQLLFQPHDHAAESVEPYLSPGADEPLAALLREWAHEEGPDFAGTTHSTSTGAKPRRIRKRGPSTAQQVKQLEQQLLSHQETFRREALRNCWLKERGRMIELVRPVVA